MRTVPPGLMAAALCLWGWQTNSPILAMILIALSEGSRVIRFRAEISFEYLTWLSDLSAVLMIGTAIYMFLDRQSEQFIYLLVRYLPLIVSPIFIAQIFGVSGKTDIRAISLISRRSRSGKDGKPLNVCMEYPFLALLLISAAFSPEKNSLFYPLIVLITASGLRGVRSHRYSVTVWLGIFLLSSSLGFAAHVGLNNLQHYLEGKGLEWFSDSDIEDSDLFRSTTAIGNIGELKSSNRIMFRARPEKQDELPILLREAAYDWYSKNEWFAVRPEFVPVGQSGKNMRILGKRSHHPRQITILTSFRKGKGVLKLPSGTFGILDLPAEEMTRNRFGAVRVEGVPDYAEYEAEYGKEEISEDSPTERDLQIPEEDMAILQETMNTLGLRTLSPNESAKKLKSFFETNFTYSLTQKSSKDSRPITDFLQVSKSGHCEYFATAGTLLLRAAGIPARYAVGFSVHEWRPMEKLAVVRTRHAHAWTLVRIDDKWTEWDFTPSGWRESEAESISLWNGVSDMWNYLVFQLRQWLWRKTDRSIYAFWLIVPLVLILGRRLLLMKKIRNSKQEEKEEAMMSEDRVASPFDAVSDDLLRRGYARLPGETLKTWISRIRHQVCTEKTEIDLMSLLNLHYRHRFDPVGITPEEYRSLEQGSRSWCAIVRHSQNS